MEAQGNVTDRGTRALLVAGGWEGHQPHECAALFAGVLRDDGFQVTVSDTLDVYLDADLLRETRSDRTDLDAERDHQGAVAWSARHDRRPASGSPGWHGGMADSFRNQHRLPVHGRRAVGRPPWQYHRLHGADHRSRRPDHRRSDDFAMHSEQYYLHVDPSNEVLATTTFSGELRALDRRDA